MDEQRKAVWGWAMYDWANSAFATTVMAGFFPVFFKGYWSGGADVNLSTARLGLGNAAAGLLVALMAPLLGAIADKGPSRKRFLVLFAYLGALMTAALSGVPKGHWGWALFVYSMGIIGFSGANVFYDALLPSVAGAERVDRVSGFGFAMGYLGGGLLFLVNVWMTLSPGRFGLPSAEAAVRCAFVTVGVWWAAFTLFTILWVPGERFLRPGLPSSRFAGAVAGGIRQLLQTFRHIRRRRKILLFLFAYWFYIDGVDTVVRMAVDYGMSLGLDSKDLIAALLITQFVGFPSALAFGRLGQRWGVRRAIYLALCVYLFVTAWGALMSVRHEFYILAAVIGLVQGGIQALSRSYYARLIPLDQAAEYYGFYNMLGKFAAILGPMLVGVVGLAAREVLMPPNPAADQIQAVGRLAARWGIASVALLFLAGGVLLYFVEDEGRPDISAGCDEVTAS